MKLSDLIKGKEAKAINQHLTRATIAEVVEIASSNEVQKKLDEIKQKLSKSSSSKYIVVAYKI